MGGLLILKILIGSLWSVFALSTDCTWTYYDNKVKVNCSGKKINIYTNVKRQCHLSELKSKQNVLYKTTGQ